MSPSPCTGRPAGRQHARWIAAEPEVTALVEALIDARTRSEELAELLGVPD